MRLFFTSRATRPREERLRPMRAISTLSIALDVLSSLKLECST